MYWRSHPGTGGRLLTGVNNKAIPGEKNLFLFRDRRSANPLLLPRSALLLSAPQERLRDDVAAVRVGFLRVLVRLEEEQKAKQAVFGGRERRQWASLWFY